MGGSAVTLASWCSHCISVAEGLSESEQLESMHSPCMTVPSLSTCNQHILRHLEENKKKKRQCKALKYKAEVQCCMHNAVQICTRVLMTTLLCTLIWQYNANVLLSSLLQSQNNRLQQMRTDRMRADQWSIPLPAVTLPDAVHHCSCAA